MTGDILENFLTNPLALSVVISQHVGVVFVRASVIEFIALDPVQYCQIRLMLNEIFITFL